jgi:ParB family chromosome partitioning protein
MSRKDRLAAIDSAIDGVAAERARRAPAPRSGIPIVNQIESVFQDSAAELETLRDAGRVVEELDPARLRSTRFSDRHAAAFADPAFETLLQDILRRGQLTPVLVRKAPDEPGRYDIIAGHRRTEACRRLGRPVLARVVGVDDRELVFSMVRENEAREDISAYERSVQIRRLVDDGLVTRQELQDELGYSKGHLSSLLRMTDVPEDVVAALGDPRVMRIAEGARLARLMADPAVAASVRTAAAALPPTASPAQRLGALLDAAAGRPGTATAPKLSGRVIRNRTGQVLVRLSEQDGRPLLRLAAGIPPTKVEEIFARLPRLLGELGLDVETGPEG